MARPTNMESLNKKIEIAEKAVKNTRVQYEQATTNLKKLLDKRDALRKDALVKAIANSSKSYEQILAYITEGADSDEES